MIYYAENEKLFILQTRNAKRTPDANVKFALAFLKENSGGHAPDGKCGALFAAEQLCGTNIDAEFKKKAGALQCLVLKRECKTSCQDCVKIAAEIVAKNKS